MIRIFLSLMFFLISVSAGADSELTIGGKTGTAHIIQAKGVSLRPRPYLNITGDSVVGTDSGGKTVITIGGSSYNTANAQSDTGWTKSGANVKLTTITDNVGIGSTDPDSALAIQANGPIIKLHDIGNEATSQLKNGGGEFDVGISDDNVPSTVSTINMNLGGEMELSVAGAGASGRFVFYLENAPKVIIANDGSLNLNYDLHLTTGNATFGINDPSYGTLVHGNTSEGSHDFYILGSAGVGNLQVGLGDVDCINGCTTFTVDDSAGTIYANGNFVLNGSNIPTSVANSDGTLTISPTNQAVIASLALGHANTWTGKQIFTATNSSTIAHVIKAAASQSVDLLDINNSSNTPLSTFDKNGFLSVNAPGTTTAPVSGAALDVTSNSNSGSGGLAARFYAQNRSQYIGIDWAGLVDTSSMNIYTGTGGDIYMLTDGNSHVSSTGGVSVGVNSPGKVNARFQVLGKGSQTASNTGTAATTLGSNIVTGTGTNFDIQIGSGFDLVIGSNIYPIKSVDSATQLTLYTPALATVSGSTWPWITPTGVFTSSDQLNIFAADSLGNFISSSTKNPQIILDKQSARAWSFQVDGNNNNRLLLSNVTANTVPFYIDGSAPANTLIINSNGNVGIGSSNPGQTLDVQGTIRASSDVKVGTKSTCLSDGTNCLTQSTNAVSFVTYQPGLLTAVNATIGVNYKFSKASTVDNIIGSAVTFSCVANPTVTFYECGTSATCAGPTTIGTVTVTAAGTAVTGTVSNSAITAGDYVGWAITAGTCASIDIAATAQVHSN